MVLIVVLKQSRVGKGVFVGVGDVLLSGSRRTTRDLELLINACNLWQEVYGVSMYGPNRSA